MESEGPSVRRLKGAQGLGLCRYFTEHEAIMAQQSLQPDPWHPRQAISSYMFDSQIQARKDGFYVDGQRLRLAGNHTWNNVQTIEGERIGIDKVTGNFTRLWTIETKGAVFAGSIWGSNTDGVTSIENGPWKKDGSLNSKYYQALERSVKAANKQDIVTGVVLFEGSIPDIFPQGWERHPFNGLGPKDHPDVHTKGKWNKFQRAHVKEVVKTLEPYGNVIYEVGNELMSASTKWFQRKVVEWVQKWSDKPVGVSYARGIRASRGADESNWMKRTGADWVSPTATALFGGQFSKFKGPIVLDTDHSWPLASNVPGLAKAWSQGHDLWLMDGFNGTMLRNLDSLVPDRNYISDLVS